MLILKLCEIKRRKKRSLFRNNQSIFQTSGFICNNIVFNVIELEKRNLKKDEVTFLLNKYKGAVLDTADKDVNEFISEYLFDYSSYTKRAVLSNLAKSLVNTKDYSIRVYDNDFRFSSEWIDFARSCRKLLLIGIKNSDMINFAEYCYNELGLNVFINEENELTEDCLSLDLNQVTAKGYVNINAANENTRKIYADSEYFLCNNYASKLMQYGVSREMACAAVQVVPFKKVYVCVD